MATKKTNRTARQASKRVGKRAHSAKATGIEFLAGYIIATEISAKGGVSYAREELTSTPLGKKGQESQFHTVKAVDDVELVKSSNSIIQQAHYVLSRFTANTPIGYYVNEEMLPKLIEAMEEVQEAADIFNKMAAETKSLRRVAIAVYPLEIRLDNEAAAKRLARTVRERIEALRDALVSGDRKAFENRIESCNNLERLSTGLQADSIKFAIEAAKEQKSILLVKLRNGMDPKDAGKVLDVSALDACIALFHTDDKSLSKRAA